jgi:hypothetical protein
VEYADGKVEMCMDMVACQHCSGPSQAGKGWFVKRIEEYEEEERGEEKRGELEEQATKVRKGALTHLHHVQMAGAGIGVRGFLERIATLQKVFVVTTLKIYRSVHYSQQHRFQALRFYRKCRATATSCLP